MESDLADRFDAIFVFEKYVCMSIGSTSHRAAFIIVYCTRRPLC